MTKELHYYPEGESNLPIKILGNNEKNMLVTLAIIQNVGCSQEKQNEMHYIDPRDKKPLILNIKIKNEIRNK
jgi:hypothetical protein